MLRVLYETDSFPPGTVTNGTAELSVTWDDILWAAVTVGRPNRAYVFRHGPASMYEAVFRWSLVRMALEQSGPGGYRLRRTGVAKTLDPTEKGAVNYFLGMTFCKLFAATLLRTPWLLHLDVFRPALNPVLTGRSRPDLVGLEEGATRWHAFESKGRICPPDSTVKDKAKTQAQRLLSVNGTACSLHVGAVTYFRNDTLHFFWRDPPTESARVLELQLPDDAWRHYYAPILEVLRRTDPGALRRTTDTQVEVEGADIQVGIHPTVGRVLLDEQWHLARQSALDASAELRSLGYQSDGLKVTAGPSWSSRFAETGSE